MASDLNLVTERRFVAEPGVAGKRLDRALTELLPEYSRNRVQQWVRQGLVTVDGRVLRPRDRLQGGEALRVRIETEQRVRDAPEARPLDIRFEDSHLLVINKPAGLVVHPAAGNPDGTLLNRLLHHVPGLAALPRAGIVHRLDKDTTGLLVVAKTPLAHKSLVEQLQARTLRREYRALVVGNLVTGGTLEAPIGRHPVHRTRMAVVSAGRPATTHYRVLERFGGHTYLQVNLETGRTHQIRVHLAHIRHPLVGDPLYGGRPRLPKGATRAQIEALQGFGRQALHALRLGLWHPLTGGYLEWETPVPEDLATLLSVLREGA